MQNSHERWRILPAIAAIILFAGCYTESNPLPVRLISPPTEQPVWQCQPVTPPGPCRTSPLNYEGKYGCDGFPSKHCQTVSGACQCVP
jgi:hypothetical protein